MLLWISLPHGSHNCALPVQSINDPFGFVPSMTSVDTGEFLMKDQFLEALVATYYTLQNTEEMPEGPLKSTTGRITCSLTQSKISPHPLIASQNSSSKLNVIQQAPLEISLQLGIHLYWMQTNDSAAIQSSLRQKPLMPHTVPPTMYITFLYCHNFPGMLYNFLPSVGPVWYWGSHLIRCFSSGPGHFLAACTIIG